MKSKIQHVVLKFVSEHPKTQVSAVLNAFPDISQSSLKSALNRLSLTGKIKRKQGDHGRYEYSLRAGEIVPEIVEAKRPQAALYKESITPKEWENRLGYAEWLLKQGLPRRANHVFLELLDVTADPKLRDKVVRCRDCCGSKPSGDGSTMSGRYVGDY